MRLLKTSAHGEELVNWVQLILGVLLRYGLHPFSIVVTIRSVCIILLTPKS